MDPRKAHRQQLMGPRNHTQSSAFGSEPLARGQRGLTGKAAQVPVSPGGCRPRGSNSRGGTEGLAQVSYEEERNGSENCEREEVSVSHF